MKIYDYITKLSDIFKYDYEPHAQNMVYFTYFRSAHYVGPNGLIQTSHATDQIALPLHPIAHELIEGLTLKLLMCISPQLVSNFNDVKSISEAKFHALDLELRAILSAEKFPQIPRDECFAVCQAEYLGPKIENELGHIGLAITNSLGVIHFKLK